MATHLLIAKERLESKLKEIISPREWRDSIAIQPSADVTDKTQHALAREMASRDLDRNASLARHLRAALGRIEDGSYGLCVQCDGLISEKRLLALPWTALCLSCQEEMEAFHQRKDSLAA